MQLKKMDPKNLKMERFKMVKEASQFWIARDEDLDLLGFFSSVVLNGIFLNISVSLHLLFLSKKVYLYNFSKYPVID